MEKHTNFCPACYAPTSTSEDSDMDIIRTLKTRLALSEARLAAIHELLGQINELFEKAREILEGDDV